MKSRRSGRSRSGSGPSPRGGRAWVRAGRRHSARPPAGAHPRRPGPAIAAAADRSLQEAAPGDPSIDSRMSGFMTCLVDIKKLVGSQHHLGQARPGEALDVRFGTLAPRRAPSCSRKDSGAPARPPPAQPGAPTPARCAAANPSLDRRAQPAIRRSAKPAACSCTNGLLRR